MKPQHFASFACSAPRRTTRKEPKHELLDHGARRPRRPSQGRSGSASNGICRPMGSLSKRSPRRWSLEGFIPVCLSVARRAYASAPKPKKKYWSTGDLGACAGSSRRCAGNAARGRQSAACWLSAGRTCLMGGALAVPLRSGPCVVDQLEGNSCDRNPRRGVCSEVSSARSRKVSSVCYVPGDQQEEPLPSHCCCGRRWRRKGAHSIEKPPVKEQGLWAR